VKAKVSVEGIEEVKRALKEMGEEKRKQVEQEVYASALDVQTEAKGNLKDMQTWDLGNLANSILVDKLEGGLAADIGPTAPYGVYVEHGTKPHFPPPDALEGWAKRHGFKSTWPICLAIAKRGTPARPYLVPAWEKVVDKFWKRIKEIVLK